MSDLAKRFETNAKRAAATRCGIFRRRIQDMHESLVSECTELNIRANILTSFHFEGLNIYPQQNNSKHFKARRPRSQDQKLAGLKVDKLFIDDTIPKKESLFSKLTSIKWVGVIALLVTIVEGLALVGIVVAILTVIYMSLR